MVIREKLKEMIGVLRQYGSDNAVFEAHQLMRFATNFSATDLVIHHSDKLTDEMQKKIDALIKRRTGGEPLQYILGTQEFMSLEFYVNRSVLIPRADTETLTEYVLDAMRGKGFMLLDIGTGTGCIPLSIAHYNSRAYVRGVDISDAAIEIAEKNCEHLGLSARATFEKLDILSQMPCGKYDIITSNPPYIEHNVIETLQTEVRDFEPRLALDGGADGLTFYRHICKIAPELLNRDGLLVFEIGYNQGGAVSDMMKKDFDEVKIIKDLCGNDRVVTGKKKQ